jgi:Family of unknown function (DUF6114)
VSTEPGRYGRAEDEPAATPAEEEVDWPVTGRFSRWRNSRPFWGALLTILSGAIILLSEKAPVNVIIHIGLQGLAGYLIPSIIVLCGVLLLVNPVQRTFYAILAILCALGSFITSNLGGFFIGMLLGIVGGSLAFAWERRDTPGQHQTPRHGGGFHPPSRVRQHSGGTHGLSLVLGDEDDDAGEPGDGAQQRGSRPGAACSGGPADGAYRTLAMSAAAVGTVLLVGSLPPHHGPAGGHGGPAKRTTPAVPGPLGQPAATAKSGFTATSAVLTGWTFDGVAHVATARGAVAMLEFTMTSLALSGATLRVVAAGVSVSATDTSLGFSGGVVLLATKFSGDLQGRAVTYTPSRPPTSVPADATVTNVVTGQPYLFAGLLQATGLVVATPQEV